MLIPILLIVTPAIATDRARIEMGVDKAISEFKVTGRGVLVAIMDRGIDWKNDDFRNEDGTTRIQYIFDLTADHGARKATTYKTGTIYTRQEINSALKNNLFLPTRDAVGHGTTTAGIAAGSGRNSPGRKYRGIAPEASLIIVKICSDGVPSHDGEAAEEQFYDPELLPIAIDFIRDKAQELNLPCVMIMNIGSQGGPTDGTSALCQKIDATVGPGVPGLIFVSGPGDEGNSRRKDGLTAEIKGQRVPVGTIWDGASALHNICPGDYVVQNVWNDIAGHSHSAAAPGNVGEIWKGSSVGPTADGRIGIDVCAPGDSVFTTYNPRSHWATFRTNLIADGQGLYGRASAVSAANPLVTGVIALMLQANPQLDASSVKDILQRTARHDRNTGTVPNVTWGYGKLDAYAAVAAAKAAKAPLPQNAASVPARPASPTQNRPRSNQLPR